MLGKFFRVEIFFLCFYYIIMIFSVDNHDVPDLLVQRTAILFPCGNKMLGKFFRVEIKAPLKTLPNALGNI